MIYALSHKTLFSHTVRLSTPEQANTLFDSAQPGDTLHSVAEFRDTDTLMNQIGSNLIQGKFKQL